MEKYKKVKKILWIILLANLFVAVLKIVIGMMISSASMTADGYHSLSDGSSNIVGLIGISIAAKPVDEDHPYGHKKFETLSGLFIAGMLFFIAGKVILDAFGRFANPVMPEVNIESIVALVITLIINIAVSTIELREGRKLGSDILVADSTHTRSDIFISIGVLATLVGIKLGMPAIIDPIASLVVAGFILHASYEIFNHASGVLVDKSAVCDKKVCEIVMGFDEVKDVHHIRSRGREDDIHIDMHVMTDPNMTVQEAHVLSHRIEKRIKDEINHNTQVIVHIEPYVESGVKSKDYEAKKNQNQEPEKE
ncbi:putative Co/Zn/Cd cation transporter (plasmid) [Peptoclostridium acidaminophilum DSM 3953]|uniref:Putative Co/Zn/Cd cation transporter n=1 Tax=Peptoclostridium acidaminophilum DSM 3953 TaxID=1286171 RepID=W8TP22_PEPAC|nr:cation diffusion facilitator family transporter [Peptoclostridium acidaminophilum]AHM57907.1 putative Co/Zn/Cd cation transporter [Peptoclostridium acidaminophilum DSM 3953]